MWRKFDGQRLKKPILEEVESVIARERSLGNRLKVCIGTDSQVKQGTTDFATVIVFLRDRAGGFMYINQESTRDEMSLKERLLKEVAMSIEIAYQLCDVLERHQVELEVHADINTDPQFKSNGALSEAMGYILSMGFIFRAKPDAFASTACANKIVN
jgi:predicted RNase H-related nuclease YkuK (DUF458 family)